MRRRRSSGVSCFRSTKRYPYGVDVASANASWMNLTRPGYICFAKLVICDASRGFLNTTMYCVFRLIVRLSLFHENRFCTRQITDVLEWWLFLVNRSVTRPSVSAIRSSNTTTLRLPASKDVGNPSCSCRLGISRFSYADCHSP